MFTERYFIVYGISNEAWADKYGLLPFTAPCSECGKDLTTDIPFFYSQFRGFKAPDCSCGNKRTPWCIVRDPKYGDLFTGS